MAPKRATRSTRVPPVTPAPNATTTTVTEAQLQALINQGVAAAMAEAEASRVRNGYDSNGSVPRPAQAARACSYSEFLKCKPLDFKGTEGVVGLTRWFEKMESVFSISNCPATSQVKFATCTLQDDALTWWNSHVKTTTPEVAHAMPWAALKKMMTDKYCPRGEIKKIETEMWNLKVKGTDVVAYNRRFQQLALMCSRMFPEEVDKIEKYIGGLPDMILGSVKASKSALPSPVHETEMPEICLPLRKRPCRTTPGPGYEVGESSTAGAARQVGPTTARADLYGFADMIDAAPGRQTSRELGYGITDTWDDLVGAIQEIAPTTLEGVNQRVIELATTVDQEDEIIYSQLDDARYDRALLRARVNMLYRDRPFHRRTALLMDEEARLSHAAWAQSMDACDQTHSEGISLRTTVMAQQSEITELQAADRRRQSVISDLLKADYRRQRQLVEALKIVKNLKTQMIEL
ncbi:reverse transcriptase domain-containing protein [Tanacetum coccineum]|uniref:Reverse transcriptase domain-containing protein n=1 Tax=Tanacetum coccineum TaxID=301880 RepID=A0ABQ5F6V6_9ASTR